MYIEFKMNISNIKNQKISAYINAWILLPNNQVQNSPGGGHLLRVKYEGLAPPMINPREKNTHYGSSCLMFDLSVVTGIT